VGWIRVWGALWEKVVTVVTRTKLSHQPHCKRITVAPSWFAGRPLVSCELAPDDYAVSIDGIMAGRILRQPRSLRAAVWLWSVTGPALIQAGIPSSGEVESLDAARQGFCARIRLMARLGDNPRRNCGLDGMRVKVGAPQEWPPAYDSALGIGGVPSTARRPAPTAGFMFRREGGDVSIYMTGDTP
jgi:hypothetical protein